MSTNQFFGTAAIFTALTSLVVYLKWLPKWLFGKIVSLIRYEVEICEYDYTYELYARWLESEYSNKVKSSELRYSGTNTEGSVIYHKYPKYGFFIKWIDFNFIYVSFSNKELQHATSRDNHSLKIINMYSFFNSKAIGKLCEYVTKTYTKDDNPYNYRITDGYTEYVREIDKSKNKDNIILSDDISDNIFNDIEQWGNDKKFYLDRGISHKRGHCYYGEPGTGKTSLVKAIANTFNMHIYHLNLSTIKDDNTLSKSFTNIKSGSIILLEDYDSFFDGRTNLCKDSAVTFSGLLNVIDGAIGINSNLLIITTNKLSSIDSAMLRSGRIDLAVEIKLAKNNEINKYLKMFYNEIVDVRYTGNGVSMSTIENICIKNRFSVDAAISDIRSLG